MPELTFIVYSGDGEVFVTTPELEEDFIAEYGEYRDLRIGFDRDEFTGSQIRVRARAPSVET